MGFSYMGFSYMGCAQSESKSARISMALNTRANQFVWRPTSSVLNSGRKRHPFAKRLIDR